MAVDLVWHGGSEVSLDDNAYTLDELVEDLFEVFEECKTRHNVVRYGKSLAGLRL